MSIEQLKPKKAKERLEADADVVLLDVREQMEFDFNRIPGAVFRPLSHIQTWISELDPEKEYIVYCHHGMRSQQACMFMFRHGFRKLNNLSGGIHSWSLEIDPKVPIY